MNPLLLEIGTEEIPAGYIEPALAALSSLLDRRLTDARIAHGDMRTFGTPRRLTITVDAVAPRQAPVVTEIMGPPEKVGYDADGNFTLAAVKFAEKAGVKPRDLIVQETEKGRYLAVKKIDKGEQARRVLQNILPDVIVSLPFPKTMRWGELRLSFARPIHSICALLGKEIIPFVLGNIKSSRYTFGHRFLHPGRIRLSHASEYADRLAAAGVIGDIGARKKALEAEMDAAAAAAGGNILPDPALVDEVVNLIEYPVPVVGRFDAKFLDLPPEVLITAMREHQRYFAINDTSGRLTSGFVAVNNTRAANMDLVARGHERVLRARLEDARFFFQTDRRTSLDEMAEKLKSVLFQADLGSMYDKSRRIETVAMKIADLINLESGLRSSVFRAARLCKADLVSHAVGEFPKLQGIMGRVYASAAGEPEGVAAAIEEHYRPTASGGVLPRTMEGAVLGMADKIDTICGCFSAGLVPTGTSDPYALRRQGIGLIQIALDRALAFSLGQLVCFAASLFAGIKGADPEAVTEKVMGFLKGRMAYMLEEDGISKDGVAAVLAVAGDDIPETWEKARALQKFKADPDFTAIAVAFKRVVNIIKKSKPADRAVPQVDAGLFAHGSETELYAQYQAVERRVKEHLQSGTVEAAFREVAGLRGAVDRFFDDVLVMDPDPAIRSNRFALLAAISALFERLADFSRLSA
jgi:glycyl-tRNA synthetase beta chain